jgi:hypothetical protein
MTGRILSAVLAFVALLAAAPASAQTDFSGTWILDRDISADLTHATLEPSQQPQGQRGPGGFSGGIGGIGFGGGHRGGGGGGGRPRSGENDNGGRAGALTPEEHARLKEIADYVRTLTSMTVEHSDHSTFTVIDPQGRSRLYTTDAKPGDQAFATQTIGAVTKWDGPHMVTTFKVGPERDLVFTYILVPATKQMALRITLDDAGRPRADVPELRLVYKMKPAQPTTPKPD